MLLQSEMSGSQQVGSTSGGMMGQQRPQFNNDMELRRHQNLLNIQQLQQTLQAAQQQEEQYKQLQVTFKENEQYKQLQVSFKENVNNTKWVITTLMALMCNQVQQSLDAAQQQELQFKQHYEAQQNQRNLSGGAPMGNQQPNAQRMMRPVMANSLGLRHLLQQVKRI